MKLLIVNSLYAPNMIGGAEKSVQNLAETLVTLGHTVSVACLTRHERETTTLNGVLVHYLPLFNIHWPFAESHSAISKALFHFRDISNAAMGQTLRDLLHTDRPDIIHTNNLAGFSTAVWREAERLGIPVVHTIRDMYLLCIRSSMYRNGRSCDSQCASCLTISLPRKAATKRIRHVVGISRFILEAHLGRGFFKNARASVVHNSYAPDLSSSTASILENTPHRLKIGYLGRLSDAKGVEYLIRAFVEANLGSGVSLAIAGEGHEAYVNQLKTIVGNYPVRFLGHVDPSQFFRQIDLLVAPSLWEEPLGRVAIEAMAHGVPTVASRRGGLVEIIEDGRTGWLFDPEIPGSLSRILVRIAAAPGLLKDMVAICQSGAAEFLPTQIAKSYETLYSSALN